MRYDVIMVGGGLGGAALAKNLAEHGLAALILERETVFRDRVRGEQMHPWGVAEAKALGVYDELLRACGQQTRWWITYAEGVQVAKRDLQETSPHGVGSFNLYHPAMQETLLQLAQQAGAEVRRGIKVSSVIPGNPPSVHFDDQGNLKLIEARLVICADAGTQQRAHGEDFSLGETPTV
jgi:2-polyprenyl-6-methoxyphenol hydroxylase-like FAD-dependent oxidoreductase